MDRGSHDLKMETAETRVHQGRVSDSTFISMWNRHALYQNLDDNATLQTLFCMVGNREAFFLVAIHSSRIVKSNDRSFIIYVLPGRVSATVWRTGQ